MKLVLAKCFILTFALFVGLGGRSLAEVDIAVWKKLYDRFEYSKSQYDFYREDEDPAKQDLKQKFALQYLHYLITLESDARVLAYPIVNKVEKSEEFKEVSKTDLSKSQKVRQKIRDADRKRVMEALEQSRNLLGDDEVAENILELELQLDKIYHSAISSIVKQIGKNEKILSSTFESKRMREGDKEKLREEIIALQKRMLSIQAYMYGYIEDEQFERPVDESLKGVASDLLRKLIAERDDVLEYLRKLNRNKLEEEQQEEIEAAKSVGEIGGDLVYSSDLGVVLDVSGSMVRHLEELRTEIDEAFEDAYYKEVTGCALNVVGFEFNLSRLKSSGRVLPQTARTMERIEELVMVQQVDAIYWFSDLQDFQTNASLRRLRELMVRGGVRLYVKSVGMQPSSGLKPLIYSFKR